MTETVINTVQFRFPAGSPQPSWVEVATFLKQLDTDLMSMETTYKTAQDRSLFIKFTSKEAMTESQRKNVNPRQFVYANGKSVAVRMSTAGANMQYVRVFDLPPELPDDNLSLVLGQFGTIEHVVREKFPPNLGLDHMYTGVRGVYMDVKTNIPPSIVVGNRKGRIFYDGLKDTCFLCRGLGHRKDSCPQRQNRNKKDKRKLGNSGSCSYADVVSGEARTSETLEISEALEEDIIEVLEEEDEEEEYIDQPTEALEEESVAQSACDTEADSEKERRRKESMEKLGEVAKAIHEAMLNSKAAQRRAEFAASRSGTGSSTGAGPKTKVARKTRY